MGFAGISINLVEFQVCMGNLWIQHLFHKLGNRDRFKHGAIFIAGINYSLYFSEIRIQGERNTLEFVFIGYDDSDDSRSYPALLPS